ncbi:MAG: hypothetical protein MJ016_02200 [Victivallaceae bacterium]|nr:hypothetical protein [Victivallaceae bacterium]
MADQKWRLNNLYHIINEEGQDVLFKMRPAQEDLYDHLWYRNLVLKARQEGFTTFIDILALDNALFSPNTRSQINAENLTKAADIFDAKVMYPYKNLPKELKEWCPIVQHSGGEVHFGNGSSIQVSVSARSGTFQFLHISEYGIVSAKFPGKAEEIMTGSIPAVPKSGFIFIESTAKGAVGPFYQLFKSAYDQHRRGEKLTPLDFRFHFYPWYRHPEYRLDAGTVEIPERLLSYFDEMYEKRGIALDEEQQAWYAKMEAKIGAKMWQEYPSYPEEAFKAAQDGAFFQREFIRIYQEKRITHVPVEPELPVYTSWDLGMNDMTTIWFWQFVGKEYRLIDYYQNSGERLAHYAGVLTKKGYKYGRHFAPHDIEVRELASGVSRRVAMREYGYELETVPCNKDFSGGIEAVREILQNCFFDKEACADGVAALETYHREWDDKLAVFRDAPVHDDSSHGADGFRTMAVAIKLKMIPELVKSERVPLVITGGLTRR